MKNLYDGMTFQDAYITQNKALLVEIIRICERDESNPNLTEIKDKILLLNPDILQPSLSEDDILAIDNIMTFFFASDIVFPKGTILPKLPPTNRKYLVGEVDKVIFTILGDLKLSVPIKQFIELFGINRK